MQKTITIIDTFGFFFRSFYALPPLKTKDGFPTGLLKGFMDLVYSIGRDYDTDYLLFALDSRGDSFRCEIDEGYKAHRSEVPQELLDQLPIAIEWIRKMGFANLEATGYEADDIIATIATLADKAGHKVRIVSHDKDLYQLIKDGRITLFDPQKKVEINSERCFEKYGVTPAQFIDYQSLVGDSADNIPGVKGIGAKTAEKLLSEFKTLDGIYKNIDLVSPKGVQAKLLADKEKAYMSKQLVTLHTEMYENIDFEEFALPKHNPILNIEEELNEYELHQIIKKVHTNGLYIKTEKPAPKERVSYTPILLDTSTKLHEIINTIPKDAIVAFDTETDSLESRNANIVGFSFCFEEDKGYYVPIAHNYLGVSEQISLSDAKEALSKIFTHKVVGQNLKYDLNILMQNFDFDNLPIYGDTMLLSWLINPELAVGLDAQAKREFDHTMIKFNDVVKKGETFANVDVEAACGYAAEDAWMTYLLYFKLHEKIDKELIAEYEDVELPFIKTLINIENCGIKLDTAHFKNLLVKANETINTLTTKIYEQAGGDFNINSPAQLGVILFETLGLKKGKKTKTGYSTDEKVLSGLVNEHEIIPLILEYREIFKLKSTYIEPLLELSSKDSENKIYTSFLQTGTSTGRISSKNPNLQNIPVRTELGRGIREGFIAQDGYDLISIDYSQIELRLLAHFSLDDDLLRAFNNDEDIHLATAIRIFGKESAQEKRYIAKSINFGLLYGMGARKLSQDLGISQAEAKGYIESYFESFSTVKEHIEKIRNQAKIDGYVKTLLGRKRIFDYAKATPMQLAAYDRESVNTVFQGSASDLMKLSMIKLDTILDSSYANVLLQIHDELIIEVKKEHTQEVAQIASKTMESIYKLNVPLKTSISIGKNWGELK